MPTLNVPDADEGDDEGEVDDGLTVLQVHIQLAQTPRMIVSSKSSVKN
jgi:hypothetical protein